MKTWEMFDYPHLRTERGKQRFISNFLVSVTVELLLGNDPRLADGLSLHPTIGVN